jgi:hypothetical protein
VSGSPLLGVYRYNATYVDGFGQWLGKAPVVAGGFHAYDNWDRIVGSPSHLAMWSQWVKAKSGRSLSLAVGLVPSSGGTLASCAAGEYDAYWTKLANNLASSYGLQLAYLRLGWEMDGWWYPWSAPAGSGKEASFAGCFRRVVQVIRQTQPANEWKFVWNPGCCDPRLTSALLYATWPGDAYVDIVGVDIYDQSWVTNSYPYPSTCDAACRLSRQQTAWSSYASKLNMLRNFAIGHGKPMAFPEWGAMIRSDGHGGADNPYFIQKMHEFIMDPASKVVFQSYFDVTKRDEDIRITDSTPYDYYSGPTKMPQAAELYRKLFGQ